MARKPKIIARTIKSSIQNINSTSQFSFVLIVSKDHAHIFISSTYNCNFISHVRYVLLCIYYNSISAKLLCQSHLFFSLNFTIFPTCFCCICTIKIHYNTYFISKYIFFALINAPIDAFINIIHLIFCIILSY